LPSSPFPNQEFDPRGAHLALAFAVKIPAAAQEIPEAKDFPRRAAIELLLVQMGRISASLAW
jgi:hypothetical protein